MMKGGLYEFSVSTIVDARRLKDFYWDGYGEVIENKAWTQAKVLLKEAKDRGARMPVIFSDAAKDRKHCCVGRSWQRSISMASKRNSVSTM